MGRPSKYAPEVRERAVRMVFAHQGEHRSQWAAICSIAEKVGCTSETLRKWVRKAERDQGVRSGLTTDQLEELKTLRRGSVLSSCFGYPWADGHILDSCH